MKRILACLVAAVMLLTVSLPISAEDSATVTEKGDYAIDINGNYTPRESDGGSISADVVWEAMRFTYTAGDEMYDPISHKSSSASGTWSDKPAKITVRNHSNVGLTVKFTFATENGVLGSFTENKITVESADDDKYRTVGSDGSYPAPSGETEFYIHPSSPGISSTEKLGTITVNIGEEEWQEVSDGEALVQALETGGRIKLMSDISLPDLENNEYINIDGVKVTLDLNGHKLAKKAAGKKDEYGDINLSNSIIVLGSLTVMDSKGGGSICDEVGGDGAIRVGPNGNFTLLSGSLVGTVGALDIASGTVAIKGGTVNGEGGTAIYAIGGTLNVSGGSVKGKENGIYASESVSVNIDGGSIEGGNNCCGMQLNNGAEATVSGGSISGGLAAIETSNDYGKPAVTLKITGGTFTGGITDNGKADISLTGGTFDKDPSSFVANGYMAVKGSDGKYTVVDAAGAITTEGGVSTVNTEAALSTMLQTGGNIKLGGDLTLTSAITITKDVTLDLNGKTLTGQLVVSGSAVPAMLTVKDTGEGGSLTSSTTPTIQMKKFNCTVNIEGGSVCNTAYGGAAVRCDVGTLNISGGTVKGTGNGSSYGIYNSGATTVSGGEISGMKTGIYVKGTLDVTNGTVSGNNAIKTDEIGSASISGGTIKGNLDVASGSTLKVTGGSFSADPSAYVESDYTVDNDSDGYYTVKKRVLADIVIADDVL